MYTVEYFIDKFSKIPNALWFSGDFKEGERLCANGHCGVTQENGVRTLEVECLIYILAPLKIHSKCLGRILEQSSCHTHSTMAAYINDGQAKEYRQPNPKQRILAALYDIRKLQQPKETFIPASLKSQAKELIEVSEVCNPSAMEIISELELTNEG